MGKYCYFFKTDQNGSFIQGQCGWPEIVGYTKKQLNIDRCELHISLKADEFLARLDAAPLQKKEVGHHKQIGEEIRHNDYDFTLDIDTYIQYIRKYDDGFFYVGNTEDPKLYNGNRLVLSAISHENYVEFYITEAEKVQIQKDLGIILELKK